MSDSKYIVRTSGSGPSVPYSLIPLFPYSPIPLFPALYAALGASTARTLVTGMLSNPLVLPTRRTCSRPFSRSTPITTYSPVRPDTHTCSPTLIAHSSAAADSPILLFDSNFQLHLSPFCWLRWSPLSGKLHRRQNC